MVVLASLLLQAARPVGAQTAAPAREMPLLSREVTEASGFEGRLLWIDGYANLGVLSTRENIARLMEKARRAGINTIVFGAKMFGGQALYKSEIAPRLIEWRGQSVSPDLDMLGTVITEAHARGMKVHAAVDVFSEGHRLVRRGPAYEHPEWQTTLYRVRRELVSPDGKRLPIYAVNTEETGEWVTAYTPGYGWRNPPKGDPDESRVVTVVAGPAQDMRVMCVIDCALLKSGQPLRIPRDGVLLYARGDMADWMLRVLHIGDHVQMAAVDQFVPIGNDELEGTSIFVNAVMPQVRARARSIIEEIVRKYDVDGVTLDRMRFHGVTADFSDYTRAEFEKATGKRIEHWPDDILKIDPIPGRPFVRGPLFTTWVEWRSGIITRFLRETVASIRTIKPAIKVGVYVGSWYSQYYSEGANWADPDFQGGYDWMTATYGQTGYARDVDYITTGCYYPRASAEEALVDETTVDRTVEMAAQLSSRVINDGAFFYVGLYAFQYRDNADEFRAAVAMARRQSQGVMIFDTSHLNQYNTWGVLEEAFTSPATAPHDVPDLLSAVRRLREAIRGGIAQEQGTIGASDASTQ